MGNTIERFDFTLSGGREMKTPPMINIVLQRWSGGGDSAPCISPDLANEAEIDHHIAALKDDLDEVGRCAKAALKKAK